MGTVLVELTLYFSRVLERSTSKISEGLWVRFSLGYYLLRRWDESLFSSNLRSTDLAPYCDPGSLNKIVAEGFTLLCLTALLSQYCSCTVDLTLYGLLRWCWKMLLFRFWAARRLSQFTIYQNPINSRTKKTSFHSHIKLIASKSRTSAFESWTTINNESSFEEQVCDSITPRQPRGRETSPSFDSNRSRSEQ